MLLSKVTYICATHNVYTFYIYTDGTLHIRGNQGFSVLLKDASTGNRTSNLLITRRLLSLLYHCLPHTCNVWTYMLLNQVNSTYAYVCKVPTHAMNISGGN